MGLRRFFRRIWRRFSRSGVPTRPLSKSTHQTEESGVLGDISGSSDSRQIRDHPGIFPNETDCDQQPRASNSTDGTGQADPQTHMVPAFGLRYNTASICVECRSHLETIDQLRDALHANQLADPETTANSTCPFCWMMKNLQDENLWYTPAGPPPRRENGRWVAPQLQRWENALRVIDLGDHSGLANDGLHIINVPPLAINFESLKEKVRRCCDKHENYCNDPNSGTVPGTHVIDCTTRAVRPLKSEEEYVALSYVWGNPCSSPAASEVFMTKLSPTVERTIEDALIVTLEMGYNYLWVDKYCIDQHDRYGKMHQIRNMDSIYKNAALTIIAAAGGDSAYGLPGVASRFGTRPRIPRTHYVIGHTLILHRIFGDELWNDLNSRFQSALLTSSTWNTRGWTFQEGLLSRRCLVFTDEQVSFACRVTSIDKGSKSEQILEGPYAPYRDAILCAGAGDDCTGLWRRMDSYSERVLTRPGDFLNAFSGTLKAFSKMVPAVYHV